MNCPGCHAQLPPTVAFCPECGASRGGGQHAYEAPAPEPAGLQDVPPPAAARPGPGPEPWRSMAPRPPPPPAWVPYHARPVGSHTQTVTVLLAIIPFLCGCAGVHRIYTGKVVSGIFQFLTWGFFFWQVYDIIKILSGSYLDADGYRLRDS